MEDLASIPYFDVDDDELTDEQILEKYPVRRLGMAWARNEDGSFRVPEFTLGWEVAIWCSQYLNPLGEDEEVFRFTNEQFRFVLWWYAVDEDGGWLFNEAVLQRIKGWGKDPLTAVLSLVEAFGPSRFSHFDENGWPKGKRATPEAWVQVFALSREQTTNTAGMFPILISEKLKKYASVQPGVEIIRGFGGAAKVEMKTASWRSAEGGRPTFLLLNETQHFLESNGGHDLAATARRNASKRGRTIAITNAPKPGEESVAEGDRTMYDSFLEGRAVDREVLYDSIEAPDHAPLTERVFRLLYEQVRGDSVWCDPHRAWLQVTDLKVDPADSRRMYLNQMWQSEDALYTPDEWARIRSDSTLVLGDMITLGFDGSKTDDSTALVAVRVRDGLMVPLLLEERPDGVDEWMVDVDRVDAAVHRAFRDYHVVGFWADVALWATQIQQWSLAYGHGLAVQALDGQPIAWDMRARKRAALLHEAFMEAITDGVVFHGRDPYGLSLQEAFRRHVMNAVRRDTSSGVSFTKRGGRKSKWKVDMYAAAMLAFGAYKEYQLKQAMAPETPVGPLTVRRY